VIENQHQRFHGTFRVYHHLVALQGESYREIGILRVKNGVFSSGELAEPVKSSIQRGNFR